MTAVRHYVVATDEQQHSKRKPLKAVSESLTKASQCANTAAPKVLSCYYPLFPILTKAIFKVTVALIFGFFHIYQSRHWNSTLLEAVSFIFSQKNVDYSQETKTLPPRFVNTLRLMTFYISFERVDESLNFYSNNFRRHIVFWFGKQK